jgi:hypothetical protein
MCLAGPRGVRCGRTPVPASQRGRSGCAAAKRPRSEIGTSPPVLPPEAIVTKYPQQLNDVAVGLSTLGSVSDDPDADGPDVELLTDDLTELEATATIDEANPYTSSDALRQVAC